MSNRNQLSNIQKISMYGLLVNLILSFMKFLAGYFGNSKALIADAFHSLSDCLTDIMIIIGAVFWTKPADKNHQYGHGRIETITTMILGFILIGASFSIGYDAVTGFSDKTIVKPGKIALITSLISIFIKEILFRFTMNYAKKIDSQAVIANAWHHRLDALSSIPAFAAIGGSIIFPELYFLDSAGAIIVSVFIFQAAVKMMWPGIQELLETGASPELCREIETLAKNNNGVLMVEKLRTRYQGLKLFADMTIVVDPEISVRKGHEIAEQVKEDIISKKNNIADIIIHIEPGE